jgi:tripartite-type tricarboxylate transporter receptor subunit TctC
MKLPRRRFLHLAAGAAALPAMPRVASALDYPTRPVRIIVGFPAGGSSDLTARLIGQWLSERLGQQFNIENRPGAGTNIATDTVIHATPDGYTLLWVTQTNAINVSLYTLRAGIERGQWVVVVYPQGVETKANKVFGTRQQAELQAHYMINRWLDPKSRQRARSER